MMSIRRPPKRTTPSLWWLGAAEFVLAHVLGRVRHVSGVRTVHPNDTPRSRSVSTSDLRDRAQQLREQLPRRRGGAPPEERGRRLATLARGKGEEIRISWDSYEGRPYLSLRLWSQDDGGGWWPTKVGFTVRIRELPDVAAAIAEALDLAEEHLGGSRPQRRPQRQAGDGRPWHPSQLPGIDAEPGFDEFGEGGAR
jgi:hypothetical protein